MLSPIQWAAPAARPSLLPPPCMVPQGPPRGATWLPNLLGCSLRKSARREARANARETQPLDGAGGSAHPGGALAPPRWKLFQASLLPACMGIGLASLAGPALAEGLLREEPSNALSFPTWVIHISSVTE
ncbi:unnamed protein product, partial [Ostreobium quekettii]